MPVLLNVHNIITKFHSTIVLYARFWYCLIYHIIFNNRQAHSEVLLFNYSSAFISKKK